jgi:hypothetical protein
MEEREILMLSLITALSGICVLMLKLCFRSKCSTIDLCCGLLKIKREVHLEKDLTIKPTEAKNMSPLSVPQQPQQEVPALDLTV